MKCPKCSYVSHDYLDTCGKCSMDLMAFKQEIGLVVLQPGDLDLAMVFSESGESYDGRGGMSLEDSFFGTQMLVEPESVPEQSAEEFDIKIDDDVPQAPAEPSAAPGELTKLFYVPEDLASQSSGVKPPNVAAGRGAETADTEAEDVSEAEAAAEKTGSPASSSAGPSMEQNIQSTVHTMEIDMSDLVDLDAGLDELEEPSITMDAPEVDQEPSGDLEPAPTPEAESLPRPDMAPEFDTVSEATEEVTLEDEFPEGSAVESPVPGELTREFYVPEELVDQPTVMEPLDAAAGAGEEAEATEEVTLEDEFPEGSAVESPVPGELTREFYVPEELADQPTVMEPLDAEALDVEAAAEKEGSLPPSASVEAAETDPESPDTDESAVLRLMDTENEPAEEQASEAILDLESDDLLETELVLELEDEEEGTTPPQPEKRTADPQPDGLGRNQLELEDDEKS
jgi:hypothetical protein